MSDLDLKANVYKWEVDDSKRFRKPRYNDYDDCKYYTGTEWFLLCREKVSEETERKDIQKQMTACCHSAMLPFLYKGL